MRYIVPLLIVSLLLIAACGNVKDTSLEERYDVEKTLSVRSGSFQNDSRIPEAYTCDSGDFFPTLMIGNVPKAAKSFAVMVEDPDAPSGTWTHLIAWDIPIGLRIDESLLTSSAVVGENDFLTNNYRGPCPPKGNIHRYFFKVYALNQTLMLDDNTERQVVIDKIMKDAISYGETVGTYSR